MKVKTESIISGASADDDVKTENLSVPSVLGYPDSGEGSRHPSTLACYTADNTEMVAIDGTAFCTSDEEVADEKVPDVVMASGRRPKETSRFGFSSLVPWRNCSIDNVCGKWFRGDAKSTKTLRDEGGIYVVTGGKARYVNEAQDLPTEMAKQNVEDDNRTLWSDIAKLMPSKGFLGESSYFQVPETIFIPCGFNAMANYLTCGSNISCGSILTDIEGDESFQEFEISDFDEGDEQKVMTQDARDHAMLVRNELEDAEEMFLVGKKERLMGHQSESAQRSEVSGSGKPNESIVAENGSIGDVLTAASNIDHNAKNLLDDLLTSSLPSLSWSPDSSYGGDELEQEEGTSVKRDQSFPSYDDPPELPSTSKCDDGTLLTIEDETLSLGTSSNDLGGGKSKEMPEKRKKGRSQVSKCLSLLVSPRRLASI